MTAFDEVQFSPRIALGAQGGPEFRTRIISTAAGFERRNQDWATDRGRWNVGSGIKTRADFDWVLAFFRARRGRARGFRFKDWSDYTDFHGDAEGLLKQNPDGQIQLAKVYTDIGGNTYTRLISKPVNGTLTLPASCTVDYTTGICTGAGAVADAAWSGQFDVPVRFDTDHLNVTVYRANRQAADSDNDIQEWPDIPIVELRA